MPNEDELFKAMQDHYNEAQVKPRIKVFTYEAAVEITLHLSYHINRDDDPELFPVDDLSFINQVENDFVRALEQGDGRDLDCFNIWYDSKETYVNRWTRWRYISDEEL